jgi:cell division protease FtsH
MARHMVCALGMSEELGPVNWGDDSPEPFMGRSFGQSQGYSEDTARRIDVEVKRILDRAYDMARKVLTANIHVLHQVAQKLLENESLNNEEFSTLVAQAHAVDVEGLSWAPA